MGLEISRRLIGGKWRTASAEDGNGNGGSSSPKGPITVTPADVPNDQDTVEIYTPTDGALIYDILFSPSPAWNATSVADLYDGDPDTGMSLGNEGNTDYSQAGSTIDDFGARSFISLCALTGGAAGDCFPYVSTGEPITLRMSYLMSDPYPVTAVNQGTKTFTLTPNGAPIGGAGAPLTISGSTGNDGTYTIVSVTPVDAFTVDIVVVEAIPSAVADGTGSTPLVPTTGETQFLIDDRGVPTAP